MKKIILASLIVMFATPVMAETLNCTVSGMFAEGIPVSYKVKIIPISSKEIKNDLLTGEFVPKKSLKNLRYASDSLVGISKIVWNGVTHTFLQTRIGNSGNALIGFFVDETYPTTVRVDYWKKDKPIYIYEPFAHSSEVLSGNCKVEK